MHATEHARAVVTEIRFAGRRLLTAPAITTLTAGTLALGLASTIVGWVLVRDVLLRPLPFRDAERLVRIVEVSANGGRWWPSFPNAVDWRQHARLFTGIGIADVPRVAPVLLDGSAARVPVSRAAHGLFETLGIRPAAGRFFTVEENRPGGPAVAIVSERFWRHELRTQPLSQITLGIGLEKFTVVGVLPRDFRFLGEGAAWTLPADIWTPMERDSNLGRRTSHGYHVVGRLREGVALADASADMNRLAAALKAQHREPTQADTVLLTPLHDFVIRNVREPLRLLLFAACAVLLVCCLNVGAAILARGLNRGRELSLRLALGATRLTLARHLLVDAGMLAVPGAVLGLTIASAGFRIIKTSAAGTLPRLDEAGMDVRAAAVALALSAATACLAGVVPAVLLTRRSGIERLRTHGATTGPPGERRIWNALVVAQLTLTVALLTGTGLLVRSFTQALAVDLGYDPRNVLAVDVALPESRYLDDAWRTAFYDAVLDRLRSTPGIHAAGLTSTLPQDTSTYTSGTRQDRPDAKTVLAGYRLVDPGYFEAAGIPFLQGSAEALSTGGVIDRRLVDVLWAGASPLGDRVVSGFATDALSVNAVVGTIREWNQGDETTGAVYQHYRFRPERLQAMHIIVRYAADRSAAFEAVRTAFAAVDPLVPISIEPLAARATESLRSRRLLLLISSGFGLIALALAAAGVYAMVAFAASRQMRESAIRLALGAHPSALGRRVVVQGVAPAALAAALGIVVAVPLGRAMQTQLFHVSPTDPAVLVTATSAVLLAAVLASLVPARRAARVDPMVSLRAE